MCMYVCTCIIHRRIQDFVRGAKALLAPPGSAPDYLGEQYFVGRGGQGPLSPPPLDPRLLYVCMYTCIKCRLCIDLRMGLHVYEMISNKSPNG